jgi:hypothetical protein
MRARWCIEKGCEEAERERGRKQREGGRRQ